MTYQEFIEFNKTRDQGLYTEKHHIVPKCIGGSDDTENLIQLSWGAHYLAHILFAKENPDNGRLRKMLTPDLDAWLRRCYERKFHPHEWSDEQRKKKSSCMKGTCGKPHSAETKKKISESMMGHQCSDETKAKISESNKGKKITAEHKEKISAFLKGKHWKLIDGKRVWYAACTKD